MNGVVSILNLQTAAKAPAAAQQSSGADDAFSFLKLLQNFASAANISVEEAVSNAAAAQNISGGPAELDNAAVMAVVEEEAGAVIQEDGESVTVDIAQVLAMLGVPAEVIPAIIAALIDPEIVLEGGADAGQVLMLADDAGSLIAEAAQHVYAGSMPEIAEVPEQALENIADFAEILAAGPSDADGNAGSAGFKGAVAAYVYEKLEVGGNIKLSAENFKEAVKAVLNGEGPELELLASVKTGVAAKPEAIDYMYSMRRAVNVVNAEPGARPEQEAVQGQTAAVKAEAVVSEAAAVLEGAADGMRAEAQVTAAVVSAGPAGEPVYAADLEGEVEITDLAKRVAEISKLVSERSVMGPIISGNAEESYEIRLRLKPEALGELFLKITYSAGSVGLNIVAANPAAERAILSQMHELRASLGAQEVNLAELNLSNFEQNQQAHDQQSDLRQSGGAGSFVPGEPAAVREESDRREVIANYIRSRRIFYKTI